MPASSSGSTPKSQSRQQPLENFPFLSINAGLRGDEEDERSRRFFVRSYAKRAALEQRKLSANPLNHPERSNRACPAEAEPLAKHVTRFRVASSTNRKHKPLKRKSELKGNISQEAASSSQSEDVFSISLDLSPSRGRFDAFGIMPITFGPQEQKLLYFYKNSLSKSFLAFDSRSELIQQSATDPAWLNATLSLIALYFDLSLGRDVSPECLYHKGEALRLANERLAPSAGQSYSVATIAAVALLANFDITIGSLHNAAIHMNGLHELVNLTGGVSIPPEEVLVIYTHYLRQTRVDLQYSSTWHTHPRFEFAGAAVEDSPGPYCNNDLGFYFTELRHPVDPRVSLGQILTKLCAISNTKDLTMSDYIGEFNNCLYLCEYRLLTRCDGALPEDKAQRVFRTKFLSLCLYVHIALRELPLTSMAAQNISERLRASLDSDIQQLYNLWEKEPRHLLWVMFMGAVVVNNVSHREYFIDGATYICDSQGIDSLEKFKYALKDILWLEHFCELRSVTLWGEIASKMWSSRNLTILSEYDPFNGGGYIYSQ
ncbi:hypothetical protein B7463_g8173, partial [Scytalidium lignicola]